MSELLLIDRDAIRAELKKAFDERTTNVLLEALERVAAQVHSAGVQREDFTELKEIVARIGVRMDQLTERMDQLTARMEQLAERMEQLVKRMELLTTSFDSLRDSVGMLKGRERERFYRERAPMIFGVNMRKGREIGLEIVDVVADALERKILSQSEARDLLDADLFFRGNYRGQSLVLVGEVSWTVDQNDVQRAVRRAALLRKLGYEAAPFAGGDIWTGTAVELAKTMEVLS
ncbi:MAG: hypothetical protein L0Y55_01175, partial [Anaerolineales bacterium]|nr:hypothetical protein [Anaerolineales bacterium]